MESLSHVHHAVFLILTFLQRNQEVDSVVLNTVFNERTNFSFRVHSSRVAQ